MPVLINLIDSSDESDEDEVPAAAQQPDGAVPEQILHGSINDMVGDAERLKTTAPSSCTQASSASWLMGFTFGERSACCLRRSLDLSRSLSLLAPRL